MHIIYAGIAHETSMEEERPSKPLSEMSEEELEELDRKTERRRAEAKEQARVEGEMYTRLRPVIEARHTSTHRL